MASRVFLTGGGGFVGARLIPALLARGCQVLALDRSGRIQAAHPGAGGLTIVPGDLLQPPDYRDAMASADVVVHLAAATGRATEADHFRINAEGTEELLDQCRRSGGRPMLFVSSIAVTFDDVRDYHYARAKRRAEEAVRSSGMDYTIVRPTMILGPGSPIQQSLGALATLPVMPVFGTGEARVQPVHVDDVVASVVQIVTGNRFQGETIEIGGPTVLSIEELMQRLRIAKTGARGRVLHVPLGLVVPPLRWAETIGLGRLLPLSAGQLASFRSDGMASAGPGFEESPGTLADLPDMLVSGGTAPPDRSAIDRECRVFTRYLVRSNPTTTVAASYRAAHDRVASIDGGRRFDRLLVRVAAVHPLMAKVADAYARVFVPASRLRRKLVLLLAILETSAPSYRVIDAPPAESRAGLLAKMIWVATGAALSFGLGAILLAPAHLLFAVLDRKAP